MNTTLSELDLRFLREAFLEAHLGLNEGGIPIGSVLVIEGKVVGRGYNRRVQSGNPILHAEMDCIQNAGRLSASAYAKSTLYSTLSPCWMCSGTALLYKIPRIVVGENQTFQGPEAHMKNMGVELVIANDADCIQIMSDFIQRNSSLWNEDIGV